MSLPFRIWSNLFLRNSVKKMEKSNYSLNLLNLEIMIEPIIFGRLKGLRLFRNYIIYMTTKLRHIMTLTGQWVA